MGAVPFKSFTDQEHATWQTLYGMQKESREQKIVPEFAEGLEKLGIESDRIPDIDVVNARLQNISGFTAVPVDGYEETDVFFARIARREFPVGNFIRDKSDLSYTPAPDVFHDLYGHVPFLAWREYADFVCAFGQRALEFKNDPQRFREFDRLFWFSIEFSLIKTSKGKKIFGAGIASSFGECRYAMSDEPEVLPFDFSQVRHQEFRIDEMQKRLFLFDDLPWRVPHMKPGQADFLA